MVDWYVQFDEYEGLYNRQQVISTPFHPINLLTPLPVKGRVDYRGAHGPTDEQNGGRTGRGDER